ncbi:tRNA-guanine transglycosylase DpdA [Bacillus sp. JJ1562]|uniref:tRNA-guanine transglycosylase DpdA n=1 Tax=Bacillus sp. JJ1562 TaxID=3122960 RepID=UPI00300169CE
MVITSCTGEKVFKPENQLIQSDFIEKKQIDKKEAMLHEYKATAGKMYTGMQHVRLMEGVESLRSHYGRDIVDVSILSAGYGLIDEERVIVPYEVTFNNMNAKQVIDWSNFLDINRSVSDMIKGYDLVFFLLGDKYLKSVQLPLPETTPGQKLIFLASKTSKSAIPNYEPYHFVEVGQEDAKEFSYGLIALKGYLFKLLTNELNNDISLLDEIHKNPQLILEVLEKYRIKKNNSEQLEFFPFDNKEVMKETEKKTVLNNEEKKVAPIKKKKIGTILKTDIVSKNYQNFGIKYFMPENDDRVDPNFDFIAETHTENRDPHMDDVYSHEIYPTPNYDGLLVSKMVVDASKNKRDKVMATGGIHNFTRIPSGFPILGDCGAYSYKDAYEPPYETDEILDYYEILGFDIGVSIDHLILQEHAVDPDERKRRLSITELNAENFIKGHYEGNYTFKPSGIAQGWDAQTYVKSVRNLIDMGYQHISLGGLAYSSTEEIYEILKNIAPILPEYMEVHLFGAARLEPINVFHQLGVTSFDSTSYLRQAWMSARNNYFSLDGNKYGAIRVPQATESSPKIKKLLNQGIGTLKEYQELEAKSMKALRLFDKGLLSLEETLNTVMAYDEKFNDEKKAVKQRELYQRTLEDTPWKKCECKICREVGIEVIIFRGNNRNRRRGFHNTYVFYKQLNDIKKSGLKI